jgi:hypothetical protein
VSSRDAPGQIGRPEDQHQHGNGGRIPDHDRELQCRERGIPRMQRKVQEIERRVGDGIRQQRMLRQKNRDRDTPGEQLCGQKQHGSSD